MKKRLTEFLKDKKSGKLLLLVGIIGIVLIYISSAFSQGKTEEVNSLNQQTSFSTNEYTAYIEEEIKEIVAAISGDTEAVVTVMLDTEVTYVYADERKENNQSANDNVIANTEQTYITVTDSDGGEKPLVVTAYMPKVRGVAIVCKAGSSQIIDNIEGAVTAALDITKRKIFISDKKGE